MASESSITPALDLYSELLEKYAQPHRQELERNAGVKHAQLRQEAGKLEADIRGRLDRLSDDVRGLVVFSMENMGELYSVWRSKRLEDQRTKQGTLIFGVSYAEASAAEMCMNKLKPLHDNVQTVAGGDPDEHSTAVESTIVLASNRSTVAEKSESAEGVNFRGLMNETRLFETDIRERLAGMNDAVREVINITMGTLGLMHEGRRLEQMDKHLHEGNPTADPNVAEIVATQMYLERLRQLYAIVQRIPAGE